MSTIYDVARLAGVAPSTVSRVLNGGSVAPERAERVRAAAEELGFVPDRAARRMNRKPSDLVALLIPDIANPFFTSLARGVEDVAQSSGLSVVLCNVDDDVVKQERYLAAARAERMAGVIISPTSGVELDVTDLLAAGTSVVAIDRRPKGSPVDLVRIDDAHGAARATAHLLEAGYRRVGCLLGPRGAATTKRRLSGYQAALKEAGLPVNRELLRHTDYREGGGYEATRDLMAQPDPPDAILATNGLLGVGCLEALVEAGLTPPAVGLASFGSTPWSRLMRPEPTTVLQPAYELGRAAAELLGKRQREPDSPEQTVVLQTSLRESASTKRLERA